jgi:hypothetical protein
MVEQLPSEPLRSQEPPDDDDARNCKANAQERSRYTLRNFSQSEARTDADDRGNRCAEEQHRDQTSWFVHSLPPLQGAESAGDEVRKKGHDTAAPNCCRDRTGQREPNPCPHACEQECVTRSNTNWQLRQGYAVGKGHQQRRQRGDSKQAHDPAG